jgi:HSP20 family molecular chaperone IbpA
MFALNTKKQNKQEVEEKSLAKQGGKALGGWENWDPFVFSLTPADLFSSSPFVLMRRFSEEMDRSFGHVFSHGSSNSAAWMPAIEIYERDGQLQVRAELPGLKPEDVKVEVTDGTLVIHGERKYEHDENKKGVYRSERRYGKFYREIPLPEGADDLKDNLGRPAHEMLSDREFEVLRMIGSGKTIGQIAEELHLSGSTVSP